MADATTRNFFQLFQARQTVMKTAAPYPVISFLRSLRVKAIRALIVGLHLSMSALAASQDDLFNAAKLGDAKEIAQEVARGADPNLADAAGQHLLITAAARSSPKWWPS